MILEDVCVIFLKKKFTIFDLFVLQPTRHDLYLGVCFCAGVSLCVCVCPVWVLVWSKKCAAINRSIQIVDKVVSLSLARATRSKSEHLHLCGRDIAFKCASLYISVLYVMHLTQKEEEEEEEEERQICIFHYSMLYFPILSHSLRFLFLCWKVRHSV